MPKFQTTLTTADEDLNYGDIYYTVFAIPAGTVADIVARTRNANRVIVTINGEGDIYSGLMPDGKGDYFITVSKEVRKRFGIEEGDPVELDIRADNSEYGMPVPEEARELWSIDAEARHYFHTLSPGKQRSLLYLIDKLKRPMSRANKAVQIHEYLKLVKGKLDYKELNAYFKGDF